MVESERSNNDTCDAVNIFNLSDTPSYFTLCLSLFLSLSRLLTSLSRPPICLFCLLTSLLFILFSLTSPHLLLTSSLFSLALSPLSHTLSYLFLSPSITLFYIAEPKSLRTVLLFLLRRAAL